VWPSTMLGPTPSRVEGWKLACSDYLGLKGCLAVFAPATTSLTLGLLARAR
jgi:hypothetical protein